jgi:Uri superfamily endonuclease
MLSTTSNGIGSSEHEISGARSSHPGRLSRLLLMFRPPWHVDYFLQKPRRSIDRDLQERWPIDYPL